MGRSGYVEDFDDNWALIRWRGAVNSAIRGARGQFFLREAIDALDALPEKQLVANELQEPDGSVCFLGAVGRARGIDMSAIDPDCAEAVAGTFGISEALAREIMFENDEGNLRSEPPDFRFRRMRAWAESLIAKVRPTDR